MKRRFAFVPFLSCGVLIALAGGPDAVCQEKDKNTIKSLFGSAPEDLRTKVKENAVRRDRVNDWLAENVNGKGKTIETQATLGTVHTKRNTDGTYAITVNVAHFKTNVLDNEWQVYLSEDGKSPGFSFVAVPAIDAEKLIDKKEVTIQGKVKEVKLLSNRPGIGGSPYPVISIVLEDIRIDGRAFTPPTIIIKSKKTKGK